MCVMYAYCGNLYMCVNTSYYVNRSELVPASEIRGCLSLSLFLQLSIVSYK